MPRVWTSGVCTSEVLSMGSPVVAWRIRGMQKTLSLKGQVEKEERQKETTVQEVRREWKEAQGRSGGQTDHDASSARPSARRGSDLPAQAPPPTRHILYLDMLIEATGYG